MSMDAGAFGNRLGIDEAYRFAKGEEVIASSGQPAKLSRPLDWLVVADHSDNMGFFPDMFDGAPHILSDPTGKDWYDRMQIVKGWETADGETMEQVYDVVWSGDRSIGRDGKLPPVGSTVDVANANWTNTIGSPELGAVWTDPDFDPALKAVYYARVIEIPTPRWTTYDAFRYGIDLPEGAPTSVQDRAYTSPIWYTPGM